MKYIKTYESWKNLKVGDIAISRHTLEKKNKKGIIKGEKYKILNIDNDSYFIEIEDLDGNYQGYYNIRRFLPEIEWTQQKYNL